MDVCDSFEDAPHALVEVSGLTLMRQPMTTDPTELVHRLSRRRSTPPSRDGAGRNSWHAGIGCRLASTLRLARSALIEQQLTLPFKAPHTMLNVASLGSGAAPRSPGR